MLSEFLTRFETWPADGVAGFLIIVLSLVCLFAASFVDEQNKQAVFRDGFFELSPSLSARLVALGTVLGVAVLVYGALQAGNCFSMTAEENRMNQIWGALLAAVFIVGCGLYLHYIFAWSYRFNDEQVVMRHRLSKKEQSFHWRDITDVNLVSLSGGPLVTFSDGRRFAVPQGFDGTQQMTNMLLSRFFALDEAPQAPVYYKEIADALIGKAVDVHIDVLDQNWRARTLEPVAARFKHISPQGITVETDDGQMIKMPANFRALYLDYDWDITEKTTKDDLQDAEQFEIFGVVKEKNLGDVLAK